jgi:hypothetical protein
VGHFGFELEVFFQYPDRKPAWPALDQFFMRGASASPGGGRRREEKQFTETDLHQHWTASSKDKHFGKRYDYTLWLSRSPKHSTQFNH